MCPMKPTTKIRFTEPQIALLMRAHPDCNLDRLTELSFEFDLAGRIIDCIGTIKEGGNINTIVSVTDSRTCTRWHAANSQLDKTSATILQFRNAAIK
jgi:hypothetical protein